VSEHGFAAKLEKVTERLAADVPNMLRSGSELIAYYLSDDRRPTERTWSRRHWARSAGWKQPLQAFTIYFEGRIPAP
jgi:hypothetical protein